MLQFINHTRQTLIKVCLLTLFICTALGQAISAPKADLWLQWTASDTASPLKIDHQPWQAFLTAYVKTAEDQINRVDYKSVSQQDRKLLDSYLQRLSNTRVGQLNRDEQRALWINLYNALTVRVVLDAYPVESIRDIKLGGFFSSGPWGTKIYTIDGTQVSLDDIEHRILRPIWKDPRLHYVLNCASIGCPNLGRTVFTANNAEHLLDEAARAFIGHPRAVDIKENGLILSTLYDWYESDFVTQTSGVLDHIQTYAPPALTETLRTRRTIDDYAYDWRLNDVDQN